MIEAIDRARSIHGFHLWAYVVMPDHVHLLILPARDSAISPILTSLKQSVARRAVSFVRARSPEFLTRMADIRPNGETTYRFWQRGGGHDRNLWEPFAIWSMIDYIHANPVRRELCERPEAWPWSSAVAYLGAGSGGIALNLDSLPEDPRP